MIHEFYDILNRFGIDPTPEEVADILWMARQIAKAAPSSHDRVESEIGDDRIAGDMAPDEETADGHIFPEKLPEKEPPREVEKNADVYPPLPDSGKTGEPGIGAGGTPVRVPGAPALPRKLAIGRSLRPLMRKAPSKSRKIIDVEATVRRIAESDIWLPVLKPESSRWLDAVIVVDESPSMLVWRETIAELKELLEEQGAFRDVQIWSFRTDDKKRTIHLYRGTDPDIADKGIRDPQELILIDPKSRRVILVVSDCASSAWQNGRIAELLNQWTEKERVAILQMLPHWLWDHSGLGTAEPVYLKTRNHETINADLEIMEHPLGFDKDVSKGSKLPVVTLEPRSLFPWAKSVVGIGGMWIPGVVMMHQKTEKPVLGLPTENEADSPPEHEKLLEYFQSVASPEAQELAGYLATVPLTMPIMRLVQQEMLPESGLIHLAEIFLYGMIERQTPGDASIPSDEVIFEFSDGLREMLVEQNLISETIKILSIYIEKYFGSSITDFMAMIAEYGAMERMFDDKTMPFAKISSNLFKAFFNPAVISHPICREISAVQIFILNAMLQASVEYTIEGVDIVVTRVAFEKNIPNFVFLVQAMMQMKNLNVIFAVARMNEDVYVVARSKTPDVDVGDILKELGGGGGAFAAEATIKDKTLPQTENQLLEILSRKVRIIIRAKDLMSSPPIMTSPDISCRDARSILRHYNINALLVTEKLNGDEKLLGYITRNVVTETLSLGLENASVRDYMNSEMGTVAPDSELREIQNEIFEKNQRIIAVVEDEKIKGVITRTEFVKAFIKKMKEPGMNPPGHFKEDVSARNVVWIMNKRLSDQSLDILKKIGQVGEELQYGVYVVGGFVRDLFMNRPYENIDIVVERDDIEERAINLAKRFAEITDSRINTYPKFQTAVIIFKDGFKIDVVPTRLEIPSPSAPLRFVSTSINSDLYRRDFTINSLAIHLNPNKFGTLIDNNSALRDIKEKSIRVIHNLSFAKDATRVFRAIRFEQRLGFSIGKLTSSLIEDAVKKDYVKKLRGRRIFTELRLILQEEKPGSVIKRLCDYDLLNLLHPSIKPTQKLLPLFDSVKQVLSWHNRQFPDEPCMKWAVYFSILIRKCDKNDTKDICERFELEPSDRHIFLEERFHANDTLNWLYHNIPVKNSELYNRLSPFRLEMVLYMMATSINEETKNVIPHYLNNLRQASSSVTGKDLIKMGLPPGPVYGEILRAVLDAKLDGVVKTRDDELAFTRKYISDMSKG